MKFTKVWCSVIRRRMDGASFLCIYQNVAKPTTRTQTRKNVKQFASITRIIWPQNSILATRWSSARYQTLKPKAGVELWMSKYDCAPPIKPAQMDLQMNLTLLRFQARFFKKDMVSLCLRR